MSALGDEAESFADMAKQLRKQAQKNSRWLPFLGSSGDGARPPSLGALGVQSVASPRAASLKAKRGAR